eukprot:6089043-Amphidinium_carterae.1
MLDACETTSSSRNLEVRGLGGDDHSSHEYAGRMGNIVAASERVESVDCVLCKKRLSHNMTHPRTCG